METLIAAGSVKGGVEEEADMTEGRRQVRGNVKRRQQCTE